ncbi:MAG TPA: sigma-E factor negative regulatory protein [Povalibacter sp.]|uniref:sigma-E factor negative regulatory protein n=1 Tax=Povalibacter sp. TaxID=1962978 RepID=UPI002CE0D3E6|nr:sigma-E factor negative regulatory protein [Povalibacter sp.]HMN44834.1 sigma-E factor negative regulatory protein [Povalibacter sp.]
MTDPVKEQLSACLDGELPEAELSLLLRQAQRDSQLLETMGRYSLISEAIRGAQPVAASRGFADRIAAAIEAEPVAAVPAARSQAMLRWMRPAAGFAIAAGVAAVAVISLQPAGLDPQPVAVVADNAAIAESQPAPSYTVPTNVGATNTAYIPAARLTNYVVAHSEYSSPLGRRTVLSGVLSDDQEQDEDVAINVTSQDSAEPQR